MAAADGGAKSALKDVGGQTLGAGPGWGQAISKAGERLRAQGPDRGGLAGSGRKSVAPES